MTCEEAIKILNKDRELCMFNPLTGEDKPMNEDCRLSASALDLAIKALEKQLPKKVIKYKCIGDVLVGGYCPACGAELHISNRPCYCGQVLNWDGVK